MRKGNFFQQLSFFFPVQMPAVGPFTPRTAAQPLYFLHGCNFRGWTLHSHASLLHLCLNWQFKGSGLHPAWKPGRGSTAAPLGLDQDWRPLQSPPSAPPRAARETPLRAWEGRSMSMLIDYLVSVKEVDSPKPRRIMLTP